MYANLTVTRFGENPARLEHSAWEVRIGDDGEITILLDDPTAEGFAPKGEVKYPAGTPIRIEANW